MLLRSIKLLNFRQFKGESLVTFSTDPQKNVTLIFGDNGSGKTTFAQAFMWCFYAKTDFADPILLNTEVKGEMYTGDIKEVFASVELEHNKSKHIVTRKIKYNKTANGNLTVHNTDFSIQVTINGQQEFLNSLESERRIKEILPIELAEYFFFDGEKINTFGKKLIDGGRVQQFAEAVKNLLGLKAFSLAIQHLKSTGRTNVVSSLNAELQDATDGQLNIINLEIERENVRIARYNDNIETYEQEILATEQRIQILSDEIDRFSDGERLQNDRKKKEAEIKNLKISKEAKIKQFLQIFHISNLNYFIAKMISNTNSYLTNTEIIDKTIPALGEDAIRFILERQECICGTEIKDGSAENHKLRELINYVPPKSIGALVKEYVDKVKIFESDNPIYGNSKEIYQEIRGIEEKIEVLESEISKIDDLLQSVPDIMAYQEELRLKRGILTDRQSSITQFKIEIGILEANIRQNENKRSQFTLQSKHNVEINKYIAYAEAAHKLLSDQYKEKEAKTREDLELTINEIFKKIYAGDFELRINPNYSIEVQLRDKQDNIHTTNLSTAQSISVIFAFITGVIELMRNNRSTNHNNGGVSLTEPYPLVMDAPLSAFDQTRIKTVCSTLPQSAEQVIFFIKDTDGNIAEENMAGVIGSRYEFRMINNIHSQIHGASNV